MALGVKAGGCDCICTDERATLWKFDLLTGDIIWKADRGAPSYWVDVQGTDIYETGRNPTGMTKWSDDGVEATEVWSGGSGDSSPSPTFPNMGMRAGDGYVWQANPATNGSISRVHRIDDSDGSVLDSHATIAASWPQMWPSQVEGVYLARPQLVKNTGLFASAAAYGSMSPIDNVPDSGIITGENTGLNRRLRLLNSGIGLIASGPNTPVFLPVVLPRSSNGGQAVFAGSGALYLFDEGTLTDLWGFTPAGGFFQHLVRTDVAGNIYYVNTGVNKLTASGTVWSVPGVARWIEVSDSYVIAIGGYTVGGFYSDIIAIEKNSGVVAWTNFVGTQGTGSLQHFAIDGDYIYACGARV